MYKKLKFLLEEAEYLGVIVSVAMYDDYINVEIDDPQDLKKITLTMTVKENVKDDLVRD